MSNSRVLKWVTGGLELFLAIPMLGGLIVVGSGYVALGVMFILHVITLILSSQNREPVYGPVLGIVTSLVAWIPFLGWLMHLVTGILLLVNAAQSPRVEGPPPRY
ncbi:hypothetical protein EBB07_06560 [Paenibacillaceae bacterium]|nr:hypothetical protein EBB07_06560 [Paenibacillaceae bacterium]